MENIIKNLEPHSNIVILTGAGISAESGIKTFRASDGLWEDHNVEDVATPQAFGRNPDLVHQFYNERRQSLLHPDIRPNPAHQALARLEREWPGTNGGDVLIVTQNIDDLHERAGSRNLIHMHGELLKMFCLHCAKDLRDHPGRTAGIFEIAEKHAISGDLGVTHICVDCGQSGGLRPDIVWFGEMPYCMDRIYDSLDHCALFLSIGTSGHVYPAAGFVSQAQFAGAKTLEINLEPSLGATNFHGGVYGPAGQKVPEFVETLLAAHDKHNKTPS